MTKKKNFKELEEQTKSNSKFYDNDGEELTPHEVKMYRIAQKRGEEYNKDNAIPFDDFWNDL